MTRKILIINGHPDPRQERYCAALCKAYADGAVAGGHEVRTIAVGALAFDLVRSKYQFEEGDPAQVILDAQQDMLWADHLVIVHPMWLGSAPALLKGFFEQAFRYGFAMPKPDLEASVGRLRGRSARIIVTMGMPAWVQRLIFGAFGMRAMARGILRISGISPVKTTLIGQVESAAGERRRWLQRIGALGRQGA